MIELVLVQLKGQQSIGHQIWPDNNHLACKRLGTLKIFIYVKQLKPGLAPAINYSNLRLLFFPAKILSFFMEQCNIHLATVREAVTHWL